MWIVGVGAGHDEFGGGLPSHCIEQLVLHGGEEDLRCAVGLVVVNAQSKQFAYF